MLTSKLTFTPLSLCSISTPPAEPPAPLELPLGLAFLAELLLVVAGVVYSCLNSIARIDQMKDIYKGKSVTGLKGEDHKWSKGLRG
jgi:hypothetical protein